MGEAKFTEGKWEFAGDCVMVAGSGGVYGYPPKPGVICGLSDGEYIENYNSADGHLIAASPEMYEMLEYVMICAARQDNSLIDASEIRSLLAKARGETK